MHNQHKVIKFYPKALIISFFIFLLPLCFYLEGKISFQLVKYWDEILTILSFLYCLYLSFKSKLFRTDAIIIISSFILIAIGVISNISSKITSDILSICIDIIALLKIMVPFIAARYLAIQDKNKNIIKYLLAISKLFIISAFICGTISLFTDIGMAGTKRYGIPAFYFIFSNQGRLGFIIAACLLIVIMAEKNKKKHIFYEIMAIAVMVYTTKGTIYIIFIVYFVLLIMWRRRYKLSFGNALFASISVILASTLQIRDYLLDTESPRMQFIKYGFVTANNYFPLGSGFSTYGSAEAGKSYSPLYYLYGFDKQWGLSPEYDMFLNDCYLGMIVGQFGYIGTILFILIVVMMFIPLNKCNTENKKEKALAFGIFFALIISCIGSAIIKSSIGVLCFIVLGLFIGYSYKDDKLKNQNKAKLKVRFK